MRGDLAAVAENRAGIAQLVDLVHAVRDVDHRAIVGTQIAHQLEQHFGLAMRQRAGRFIQCDHAGVTQQRLADFDHLPLRDRELPQFRVRIQRHTHRFEAFTHEALGFAFVDPAERVRQLAQQQVFRDRQIGHILQFLVNHRDPRRDRRGRAREAHLIAVDHDAARIGLIFTAENLQQGRFPCAVFAHQAVHLADVDVEGHTVERAHAWKDFADIVKT